MTSLHICANTFLCGISTLPGLLLSTVVMYVSQPVTGIVQLLLMILDKKYLLLYIVNFSWFEIIRGY